MLEPEVCEKLKRDTRFFLRDVVEVISKETYSCKSLRPQTLCPPKVIQKRVPRQILPDSDLLLAALLSLPQSGLALISIPINKRQSLGAGALSHARL